MGTLWDTDGDHPEVPKVLADSLWTNPLRSIYGISPTNNAFKPSADMLVFIAYEGLTYKIPVDEVDVQLCNDPVSEDPVFETIFNGRSKVSDSDNDNDIYYRFIRAGRYLIRVAYQGIYSTPYTIQVGGLGGESSGGGGDSDDGIQIVWRPLVSFNSNGGSLIPNQRLNYGAQANEPAPPERPGYIFDGWYTNQGLTRPFDFKSQVTQSITLYAKWVPF